MNHHKHSPDMSSPNPKTFPKWRFCIIYKAQMVDDNVKQGEYATPSPRPQMGPLCPPLYAFIVYRKFKVYIFKPLCTSYPPLIDDRIDRIACAPVHKMFSSFILLWPFHILRKLGLISPQFCRSLLWPVTFQ